MYGKFFESIYDGSLYGQWEAIVTMQQLIVLADADGVIDMTPPAIAGKTSIPLEILEKGLKILSEPDPYSRSPGSNGARIQLLDEQRPWGWFLVNHKKYRDLRTAEDRRAYMRVYMRKHRKEESVNKSVNSCKQSLAQLANKDKETNTSPSLSEKALDEQIWTTGVELLGGKQSHRSLIGKWVSEHGKEKVAAAIAQAAVQRPVEPKAYITAALQERVQPTDPYYKQLGQAVAKC